MSASIYYEPNVPPAGTRVYTPTPSYTLGVLRDAFGEVPVILTEKDHSALKAISATCQDSEENRAFWLMLADAVVEFGSIRVWAVY